MKAGSRAYNSVMNNVSNVSSCDNLNLDNTPINGTVTNFHMTTGGGKLSSLKVMRHKLHKGIKQTKRVLKKLVKTRHEEEKYLKNKIHKYKKMEKQVILKIKKKRKSKKSGKKRHRGGSVVSDIVLQNTLANCNTPNTISNFPKLNGGGSDWISTHNSYSANQMSAEQLGNFTSTGELLPKGQMESCVYKGPMF